VLCVYDSANVDRPHDLKEAFSMVLSGLDDDSVSKPDVHRCLIAQFSRFNFLRKQFSTTDY